MPDTITLRIAPVQPDPKRPTSENVKVPKVKVDIMYPCKDRVHVYFHQALTRMADFDRMSGHGLLSAEHAKFTGANISKARNELVQIFLKGDAEYALFLDTDMVPSEDMIARLLCSAAISGADVIGGLCVMEGASGPVPTIYQFGDFDRGEVTRVLLDYPDNHVLQVAATGTACLLIKREVFETIAAAQPNNPYPWFREDVINGNWISEDIMFCLQANAHGHPVFVDCTTPVGHAKGSKIWNPEDVRKEDGFPDARNVVVIPVKDKFEMTSNLINQLREQGEADQIIVIDNGSQKKTRNWLSSQKDLTVLTMPGAGIHEMWNAGSEISETHDQKRNVNVTFLNNDIEIGPNFLSKMTDALRSDQALMTVCANYDGRKIEGKYQPTADICAGRYDGTGGFAGFAFTVRGEWLQSGYRFPEECKWWFGDNDLLGTLQFAGAHAGIAAEATVVHLDGGSQTAGDIGWSAFAEQTAKDRAAFEAKWSKIEEQIHERNIQNFKQLREAGQTIPDGLTYLVGSEHDPDGPLMTTPRLSVDDKTVFQIVNNGEVEESDVKPPKLEIVQS